MSRKQPEESYSDEETALRVAAALKGARVAGHKPMASVVKQSSARRKPVAGQPKKKR
jgi:hypothetical protein